MPRAAILAVVILLGSCAAPAPAPAPAVDTTASVREAQHREALQAAYERGVWDGWKKRSDAVGGGL